MGYIAMCNIAMRRCRRRCCCRRCRCRRRWRCRCSWNTCTDSITMRPPRPHAPPMLRERHSGRRKDG